MVDGLSKDFLIIFCGHYEDCLRIGLRDLGIEGLGLEYAGINWSRLEWDGIG